MDSGSAAGMIERVAKKKCHPELVSGSSPIVILNLPAGRQACFRIRFRIISA
jgi:hypothetical protein